MVGALTHPLFTLHTKETITAYVSKINLLLCLWVLEKTKKQNERTLLFLFIASAQ